MAAGKGPLRFRRTSYAGGNSKGETQSRWHRSAREGLKAKEYRQLVALCGYTVPPSIALFLGYELSTARVPAKGELCTKCERIAKDEEIHQEKPQKEIQK